jgi:hypothetical protein
MKPKNVVLLLGIFVCFLSFHFSGRGQTIFVQPHGDSIFFNSKIFKPDRKLPVLLWNGHGYSRELNAYHECMYLLKIRSIIAFNITEEMAQNEIYRPYSFDRFLKCDTLLESCQYVPKATVYEANKMVSANNFAVQVAFPVQKIEYDEGQRVVEVADTSFDFGEKIATFNEKRFEIVEYAMMTAYGRKGKMQTFCRLIVRIHEGLSQGYFLILEEGKLRLIYKWMN